MFALCLEGEWLDPDRFIAAVARMMDRNPKCASRIVRVPSFLGERFYREPLPDAASRGCCPVLHGHEGIAERPEMERLTQLVETTLDELASTNAA